MHIVSVKCQIVVRRYEQLRFTCYTLKQQVNTFRSCCRGDVVTLILNPSLPLCSTCFSGHVVFGAVSVCVASSVTCNWSLEKLLLLSSLY